MGEILCMICNKEVRIWKTTIEDEEKWIGMCIEEGCERQGQVFGLTDSQIVNIECKIKVPWNPEDEVNIDLATMKTSIVRPKEQIDEIEKELRKNFPQNLRERINDLETSLEEAQNQRDDQTVSLMKVIFKNAKLLVRIKELEKQIEDIKSILGEDEIKQAIKKIKQITQEIIDSKYYKGENK